MGKLILTRRRGERVILTDIETGVVINVIYLDTARGRAKIQFDAPERVKILREEIEWDDEDEDD